MAITFDLESVEGIAIGVATGPLTLNEIKESAAASWRRVAAPEIRVMWDLRGASFDLETREIREIAEFVLHAVPEAVVQTAFVVSRDLEFGLVRMFEAFRDQPGSATSVFRDQESALAWLEREKG